MSVNSPSRSVQRRLATADMKSLHGFVSNAHLEGWRPTVALAGHIVVPPLPVKAGWRDRQVLSGCELIDTATDICVSRCGRGSTRSTPRARCPSKKLSREETSNAEHHVNEHHRDEAAGCGELGLAIRCEVWGHGTSPVWFGGGTGRSGFSRA